MLPPLPATLPYTTQGTHHAGQYSLPTLPWVYTVLHRLPAVYRPPTTPERETGARAGSYRTVGYRRGCYRGGLLTFLRLPAAISVFLAVLAGMCPEVPDGAQDRLSRNPTFRQNGQKLSESPVPKGAGRTSIQDHCQSYVRFYCIRYSFKQEILCKSSLTQTSLLQ